MSDFDGTDLEMMLIFTLVEKGFSMANAKGCIQILKRDAWREGYIDGTGVCTCYGACGCGGSGEVLNPYA